MNNYWFWVSKTLSFYVAIMSFWVSMFKSLSLHVYWENFLSWFLYVCFDSSFTFFFMPSCFFVFVFLCFNMLLSHSPCVPTMFGASYLFGLFIFIFLCIYGSMSMSIHVSICVWLSDHVSLPGWCKVGWTNLAQN